MYACEKEFPGRVIDKKKVINLAPRENNKLITNHNSPAPLSITKVESLNAASLPNTTNKILIPLDGKHALIAQPIDLKKVALTVPIIETMLPRTTTLKIIKKPASIPLTTNLSPALSQPTNCTKVRMQTNLIPLKPKKRLKITTIPDKANFSPSNHAHLSIKNVTSLNPLASQVQTVYPAERLVGSKRGKVPKPLTTKPQILTIYSHIQKENHTADEPVDYDDVIANTTCVSTVETLNMTPPAAPVNKVIKQQATVNDNSTAIMSRKRKSLAVFMREVSSIASTATIPADDPLALEQSSDSNDSLSNNIKGTTQIETMLTQNEENVNHCLANGVDVKYDLDGDGPDIEDVYRNTSSDAYVAETENETSEPYEIVKNPRSCDKFVQTAYCSSSSSILLCKISEMKQKLENQEKEIVKLKTIIKFMREKNSAVQH